MTHTKSVFAIAWVDEAVEMVKAGIFIPTVADHFGVKKNTVYTHLKKRGVEWDRRKGHHLHPRTCSIEVSGFKMGSLRRVACSFTDDQIAAINLLRKANDMSFSAQVQALVASAISKAEGKTQ